MKNDRSQLEGILTVRVSGTYRAMVPALRRCMKHLEADLSRQLNVLSRGWQITGPGIGPAIEVRPRKANPGKRLTKRKRTPQHDPDDSHPAAR